MIGLWVQLNWMSWLPVNAHSPSPTILASLIPPAAPPPPPITPLPWNTSSSPFTSVLCSCWRPLSSALCPSLSALLSLLSHSCWLCHSYHFVWPLYYVICGLQPKECWDWTPTNQHQQPACALRHNNMAFLYWHGLHIYKKIAFKLITSLHH